MSVSSWKWCFLFSVTKSHLINTIVVVLFLFRLNSRVCNAYLRWRYAEYNFSALCYEYRYVGAMFLAQISRKWNITDNMYYHIENATSVSTRNVHTQVCILVIIEYVAVFPLFFFAIFLRCFFFHYFLELFWNIVWDTTIECSVCHMQNRKTLISRHFLKHSKRERARIYHLYKLL